MATTLRRLILAGGFAVAVAVNPAAAMLNSPDTTPLATCAPGEEEDVFTVVCTPMLVPNSPSPFTTTAANPDVPEIDGIPCIGRSAAACVGLAEDAQAQGPQPVPQSTIGSSPTVTGHLGP
ncbi:intersectin-EH binding protein Ibp1 [Mycobacterium hubeiense]|uniref:intersectin-EH binding protein Ibp1 n=1 Tax=Mycobacterium hubeiense TaxID=1867256 RepID=UPI000C7EE05F|nr:intersectin-EH binding protein Ibp1 [Mycobacterium sp. QGD 101]